MMISRIEIAAPRTAAIKARQLAERFEREGDAGRAAAARQIQAEAESLIAVTIARCTAILSERLDR